MVDLDPFGWGWGSALVVTAGAFLSARGLALLAERCDEDGR
jgi:hypothetical protein